MGSKCVNASDCIGPTPGGDVICLNNICYGVFQPGDKCGVDTFSTCNGNTTCLTGICKGHPKGEGCTTSLPATCDYGLYCGTNNICTDRTPFNGTVPQGGTCMEGSVIHNNICLKYFSVAVNGPDFSCETDDKVCVVGSFCDRSVNFKCVVNSSVYLSPCDDLESKVINCLIDNKCMVKDDFYRFQQLVDIYSFKDSCAVNRCNSDLEKYIDCKCVQSRDGKEDACRFFGGRSCDIPKPPVMDPIVIVLIIIGILFLVLGLAVVGVLYMRRRKNYSSINKDQIKRN